METHVSLKKKISSLLLVGLAAVLSFSLVSCGGKSDEEVIREGVTSEFEQIKTLDDATLEEMLGSVSETSEFELLGIDSTEFYKTWLADFDYKIENVEVDGDYATVKATITVKSLEDAMADWQEKFSALASDPSALGDDIDAIYKEAGSMLMDSIKDAPMTTTTIDLPYVLKDKVWGPDEPSFTNALSQGFAGDLL